MDQKGDFARVPQKTKLVDIPNDSKIGNSARRRFEFEPGLAGAEAAQLE